MNEEAPKAHAAAASIEIVDERTYRSEYYKKNNSWGVKQTFAARRQIFSVGGQTSQKSKAALKKIVDKAIQDMENGASEEDTKIRAHNTIKASTSQTLVLIIVRPVTYKIGFPVPYSRIL